MSIQTLAIVIGVSFYQQEDILPLPAAEIDAVNFARALRNWGIPENNIFLLLNEEANKKNIDHLLDSFSKRRENYKFVFYFCGHGYRTLCQIPKSYLIFNDSHLKFNECLNSFCLDAFFERIAKMKASESYILIDACHLRINTFVNPKLIEEMRGEPSSEKSLFCLLSSGVEKSFESVQGQYGYFTRALLNSLCRIRKSEGSPTQFLQDIQNEMKAEDLPLPDMVNFGNQKIFFLPQTDFFINDGGQIFRAKVIADIQNVLTQNPSKVIVLFGNEGSGKTTICHYLTSKKMKTIYLSFPDNRKDCLDPIFFLEQEIQEKFKCAFDELDRNCPYYLFLIDHLERLNAEQLSLFLHWMSQTANTRFLCASKEPIEVDENYPLINLPMPPLSLEEGHLLIKKIKPDYLAQEAELIYIISKGNPFKIKKISCLDSPIEISELEEFKRAISAIYSCGTYYEKDLFEEIFRLRRGILDFFEKVGLISLCEQSFVPHSFLIAYAESKALNINSQAILTYWYQQAKRLPNHSQIAKSLILAVKCCGYEKKIEKTLRKAFQCLAINQENLSYFIDGAEIFLSLPYCTSTTVYLAKSLKKLGVPELSKKLYRIGRLNLKRAISLICIGLIVIVPLYVFSRQHLLFNPIIYVKQMHPDFVGRENYLDLLESSLIKTHPSTAIPVAVLWGDGGIGKSEIAIAFANQHIKHFNIVHWIDSATEEGYLASYQHLANQLGISFEYQESIDKLRRKVHDYLENKNQLRWLLIYDNAEKEFEMPQRGNGAILITTRDRALWYLYPNYEVTPFSEREAQLLLKKITLKEKGLWRNKLIQELENYPLSLNLAAHYIAETPWMTEEFYLELLSENKVFFLEKMPTDFRYPNGLLNSWKMTANQLYQKHPKALHWLHFCSFLYPDSISFSWIEEWLMHFDKLNPCSLKMEANEILRLIVNQSLVRYDKNRKSLSLHRLKQEIFKYDDHFDPQIKENVLQFLVQSLEDFERTDEMERNPQLWPKLRDWELHAIWFLDRYSDAFSQDKIALLNSLLGSWKTIKGEYELGETYINEALKIRKELFGEEDLRTIIAMNNQAWVLMRLNKLEESKIIYLQAIDFLKKKNDEYQYVDFIMNNLSLVLKELQQYEEMKNYNQKVLQMRVKKYGKKNSYTADSMHNLASAHWKLNEYDQAINYYEQALDCYKLNYGDEHPYIAITLHSLARALVDKGEHLRAELIYHQAIHLYTKAYGKEHPYLLRCLQNLGQLLEQAGREKEALEIYKKVFGSTNKIYHKDHPHYLSILGDFTRLSERSKNPL